MTKIDSAQLNQLVLWVVFSSYPLVEMDNQYAASFGKSQSDIEETIMEMLRAADIMVDHTL